MLTLLQGPTHYYVSFGHRKSFDYCARKLLGWNEFLINSHTREWCYSNVQELSNHQVCWYCLPLGPVFVVVFFSIKLVTSSGNGGHELCQTSSTMQSGIPEKTKFLSCSDFDGLYCDFWKGFLVVQAVTNCPTFSNTSGESLRVERIDFLKELFCQQKGEK